MFADRRSGLLLVLLLALAACDTEATRHKVAGNVHFNKGEYAEARDAYRKAVAAAPRDPDARVGLGNAYLELEDYPAARAEYEEALRLAPDFPDAHRGVMTVISHTAQPGDRAAFAEYLGHAEAIIRIRPKDKGAIINAASVLSEAANPADPAAYQEAQKQAEKYLRQALAIDDRDPKLLVNLALVYARQKDVKTALTVVERIEAVQPGTGLSRYTAGIVQLIAGDSERALAELEALLAVEGIDPESLRDDFRLAPLRGDPRFAALIDAAKARAK